MSKWLVGVGLVCLAGALMVALGLPKALGGLSGCGDSYVEFDIPSGPRVWVEVADDAKERSRGLMGRESLLIDRGMLFVFPTEGRAAFWMKDTLIPLSIAFIAQDGTVVDIQDMQPLSLQPHAPATDYRYALETNRGWFASHGVEPGTRARFCFAEGA